MVQDQFIHGGLCLQFDSLSTFPHPMNVAECQSIDGSGFCNFRACGSSVIGIHGASVGSVNGFPMGTKFEGSNVIRELLTLRLEKDLDPANVVFSGIGMGDFLAEGDLNVEKCPGSHTVRTFNYRYMFFLFPVSFLEMFT